MSLSWMAVGYDDRTLANDTGGLPVLNTDTMASFVKISVNICFASRLASVCIISQVKWGWG